MNSPINMMDKTVITTQIFPSDRIVSAISAADAFFTVKAAIIKKAANVLIRLEGFNSRFLKLRQQTYCNLINCAN